MTTKLAWKAKPKQSYLELIQRLPLASIQSAEHLQRAQTVADQLSAAEPHDEGQEMYLDALTDLIATYEDQHHPIQPANDRDMLQHLLEMKGITQSQLSQATGIPKSSISEVLRGKKVFSKQMIQKLALYFQIDSTILSQNW